MALNSTGRRRAASEWLGPGPKYTELAEPGRPRTRPTSLTGPETTELTERQQLRLDPYHMPPLLGT